MDQLLIWVLVGVALLLIAIPFLFGLMISPHQQATRVELIKAPPELVWEALSDLSRQTEWRTDLKSVQLKDDDEGMRWIEHTQSGDKIVARKEKEVALKEVVIKTQQGASVQGTRQAVLSAVPGGTRVTFTETTDISSPFKRLFAQVSSSLDKHLNHYIAQLKHHFNKS